MERNPHLAAPAVSAGPPIAQARELCVLLCGRDQGADFMLGVVARLDVPDVGFLVLEAADRSWYPGRFWDPFDDHEPWLGWSLEAVDRAVGRLLEEGGELERLVLGGFSQGACIVAEYAARRPRRYCGVAVLTGTLMGPEPESTQRSGRPLAGVPLLLGTSAEDPWIPLEAVQATADYFTRAGAAVDLRVYPDRDHVVRDDEVAALRDLLARC